MTRKNTMQVVTVEAASTGSATSSAPSRAACAGSSPSSKWRIDVLQDHDRIINQAADCQRVEAAQGHDVDGRAAHSQNRPKAPARIESGIDRKIAPAWNGELPKKIRIISVEASTAPETASWARLWTA